jgi:osmotically-inducible protein OsmY
MKKFLLGLILGVAATVAVAWHYGAVQNNSALDNARNNVSNGVQQARDTAQKDLGSLEVQAQDIRDQLANSGKVIWQKAQNAGKVVVSEADDTRITAEIKGKLLADTRLSGLGISVSTTDGRVTLSGNASSVDDIQNAMSIALHTDGVREVDSTLKVK